MEQVHVPDCHQNVIEHRTISRHRIWNSIFRPQNLQTSAQHNWIGLLIVKIQVAWCMNKVTLQCYPPTLHPLTHCHWTTWMSCLAWPWLFYLHHLSLSLCLHRLQCSSFSSADSDALCSLPCSLSFGVTSLRTFAPFTLTCKQGPWSLVWFHGKL